MARTVIPAQLAADLAEAGEELSRLGDDRLLAELRDSVVEWRAVETFSSFFLPLPLVAQDVPGLAGGWTSAEAVSRYEHLGLDAQGRPVLHLLDPGGGSERVKHGWRWDEDGSFLEVEPMGSGPHVRRARAVNGRLVHVATASRWGELTARSLSWRDGLAVRSDEAEEWEPGIRGRARAVEAHVADGRIELLRSSSAEYEGDLEAGLRIAAALEPGSLGWDGRVERPERWPGAEAAAAFVEPLAAALDAALRAAVGASGILMPFVLEVRGGADERPLLPPFGRVAGVEWRDGMRAASTQQQEAILYLWRGVEAGTVAELDLVERLDGEALRQCRILSTALRTGGVRAVNREAAGVVDALGDRLAELLNETPPAHAADPFLALVRLGDPYGRDQDGIARARAAVGGAYVDRFLASIASSAPAAPRSRLVKRALGGRPELRELLAATALADHADRLAGDVAAETLHLEPARGARSRLGGPAALPAGGSWPETGDGRPLSFIAAIDLAELPAGDVATALGGAGWLLFFADLPDDEAVGLIDEAGNEPGSSARVLFAGHVTEAEPPAALRDEDFRILEPRAVRARPLLTLPTYDEAGEDLGLDVFLAEAYEQVAWRLLEAVPGDSHHWIGGHISGVQGAPADEDTTLLLHIENDSELGFEFLDGGSIQFRIPDDALAARDWSRAFAIADSC